MMHGIRVHGVRSRVGGLARGTSCLACLVEFWTRPRLLSHLRSRSRCVALLSGRAAALAQPPPESEGVPAARPGARAPAVRLAGPLPDWAF